MLIILLLLIVPCPKYILSASTTITLTGSTTSGPKFLITKLVPSKYISSGVNILVPITPDTNAKGVLKFCAFVNVPTLVSSPGPVILLIVFSPLVSMSLKTIAIISIGLIISSLISTLPVLEL